MQKLLLQRGFFVCVCDQLVPTLAPKAAGWTLGRQQLCCRRAWEEGDAAAAGMCLQKCLHPADRKDKRRVLEEKLRERGGKKMSSRVQCSHGDGARCTAEPRRAALHQSSSGTQVLHPCSPSSLNEDFRRVQPGQYSSRLPGTLLTAR